ncbi:MAG: hypothetical protein WD535_02135, partial [Thermaerobacterales bacterium]
AVISSMLGLFFISMPRTPPDGGNLTGLEADLIEREQPDIRERDRRSRRSAGTTLLVWAATMFSIRMLLASIA